MTHTRSLFKKFTLKELRKMTKARLIRIILKLQTGRVFSAIKKRKQKAFRKFQKATKRRSSGRRNLKAGIHTIKMRNGQTRRVKVLANGQWRFLKGGGKRRKSTKRRSTKGRRKSKRRKR